MTAAAIKRKFSKQPIMLTTSLCKTTIIYLGLNVIFQLMSNLNAYMYLFQNSYLTALLNTNSLWIRDVHISVGAADEVGKKFL